MSTRCFFNGPVYFGVGLIIVSGENVATAVLYKYLNINNNTGYRH